MTMKEIENDIIQDFLELGDKMNQYSFLLAYARESKAYPEKYRNESNLVKDCQVKTWIYVEWNDDKINLYTDSESFIVKGILGLMSEIYDGHLREEVEGYKCGLLDQECIKCHLTEIQIKGLKLILSIIQ
jgi:cysteine desulfuration protein SufE